MEISLEEALVEMYLSGISTRKAEDVTEALCDSTLSSSAQSRLNKKAHEKLERNGGCGPSPCGPLPVGRRHRDEGASGGKVQERLPARGHRAGPGRVPGSPGHSPRIFTRTKAPGSLFCASPRKRAFQYVGLAVSDAHPGIREEILECFPQAERQRCIVHFYRNILSFCPRRLREDLAASLKTAYGQESAQEARAKAPKGLRASGARFCPRPALCSKKAKRILSPSACPAATGATSAPMVSWRSSSVRYVTRHLKPSSNQHLKTGQLEIQTIYSFSSGISRPCAGS